MRKIIVLTIILALIIVADVFLYLNWNNGELNNNEPNLPVSDCIDDEDCKIIYSSCSCEAVPIADPRTQIDNAGLPICEINSCDSLYSGAVCQENKCVLASKEPVVASAQIIPQQAETALKDFQTARPDIKWQVGLDQKTGFVTSLMGTPMYPANFDQETINGLQAETIQLDEELAKSLSNALLSEIKDVLAINPENYSAPVAKSKGKGKFLITYSQIYSGIPVLGSYLKFSMIANGQINLINSNYYHYLSVDTQPKITQEQAVAIARQHALKTYPDLDFSDSAYIGNYLYILPVGNYLVSVDKDHLVYAFLLNNSMSNYGSHLYLIDAHYGDILLEEDMALSEQ